MKGTASGRFKGTFPHFSIAWTLQTYTSQDFTVFGGYLAKLALASVVTAEAAVVEKTKTLSEGMNVIKGEFYQC